jgi:hypothetical protein
MPSPPRHSSGRSRQSARAPQTKRTKEPTGPSTHRRRHPQGTEQRSRAAWVKELNAALDEAEAEWNGMTFEEKMAAGMKTWDRLYPPKRRKKGA